MNPALDQRVLDYLGTQQRALAGYAPGLAGGGHAQAMRLRQQPGPLLVPSLGRGASIVVAASDAHVFDKENADVVCDGIDDQEQITWASRRLYEDTPNGTGFVRLTPGSYVCSDAVELYPNTTLQGAGAWATFITVAGETDGIRVQDTCSVRDLWLGSSDALGIAAGLHGITESAIDALGFGYPYAYGVEIAGCVFSYWGEAVHTVSHYWDVHDCTFHGFRGGTSPLTGGLGGWGVVGTVSADSAAHALHVYDCRFHACSGVFNDEGDGGRVTNCWINGYGSGGDWPREYGIYLNFGYQQVANNFVQGHKTGIYLGPDVNFATQIEQNVLETDDTDGVACIHALSTQVLILGNRINGLANPAILFDAASASNHVVLNQMFGNSFSGTLASVTDAGAGNLYNADGSANFWNFPGF